ncbi:MAG TPA: SAM-dependent methyltransferase, partial [Oscillospiraceae bacterium]|nr:SAM-dependent methyltransferase [Oscillospiraceae bacterium]
NIEILKEELKEKGFVLNLFEDHSDCLKQMMVDIIFEFGTMSSFWKAMGGCNFLSGGFTKAISKSKIGYFLLVGQKL